MFYKKNLFVAALTFTVLLMALFTNAQKIIVVLKQPPPNQWNVADLWQLTLTNTSQESYNVYLYGTVEEASAGFIFKGTSATFEVPPNFSGPVNPGDLEPVDAEYPNDDYEEIVMKTGTLPPGTYTICVYVKGVDGEVMGYDCIMQIIVHSSPPELVSPVDEANVTEELPVFLWLPPMPMGDFEVYNIKFVEILDGQTPMEAMESNPAFYIEEDIPATSFQFSISARPFETGITYAWKVTTESGEESQIWIFTNEAAGVVTFGEPATLKLIYPLNGAVISTTTPWFEWEPIDTTSAVTVTWTVTPEASYTLTIWQSTEDLAERVAEGYTLTEEDMVDLKLVSITEGITVTTFTPDHDSYIVDLEPGFPYCYQVKALVNEQVVGHSEIWNFSFLYQQVQLEISYKFGKVERIDTDTTIHIRKYDKDGNDTGTDNINRKPMPNGTEVKPNLDSLKPGKWVESEGTLPGPGGFARIIKVIDEDTLKKDIKKRISVLINKSDLSKIYNKILESVPGLSSAKEAEMAILEDLKTLKSHVEEIEKDQTKATRIGLAINTLNEAIKLENKALEKMKSAENAVAEANKKLPKIHKMIREIIIHENNNQNDSAINKKKQAISELKATINSLKAEKEHIGIIIKNLYGFNHPSYGYRVKGVIELKNKAIKELQEAETLNRPIGSISKISNSLEKLKKNKIKEAHKEIVTAIKKLEQMLKDLEKCLVIEKAP